MDCSLAPKLEEALQSSWIDLKKRIAGIDIGVYSSCQSNEVALNISPDYRVVVPEVVVVKPALRVVVLPGQS